MTYSSSRTLSVKVLSVWYILGIFSPLFTLQYNACILGFYISGLAGRLYNLLLAPLEFFIGVGLWCFKDAVRRFAIWFELYTILSLLLTIVIPSSRSLFVEKMSQVGIEGLSPMVLLFTTSLGAAAMGGVRIWLLVKCKGAFAKRAAGGRDALRHF